MLRSYDREGDNGSGVKNDDNNNSAAASKKAASSSSFSFAPATGGDAGDSNNKAPPSERRKGKLRAARRRLVSLHSLLAAALPVAASALFLFLRSESACAFSVVVGVLPMTTTNGRAHHQHQQGRRRSALANLATTATSLSFSSSSSSSASKTLLRRPPRAGDVALSQSASDEDDAAASSRSGGGIDLSDDSRLYKVRLSRASGIDWGTDLSFAFVYVRDVDPTGPAAASKLIEVGDQLCQVTPVVSSGEDDGEKKKDPEPINLVGAPFDYVMGVFSNFDRDVREYDLVFFRGTKDELKQACAAASGGDGATASTDPETVTVTVIQNKGAKDESVRTLTAEAGTNLRELLVDNGINVYQSFTRWTNCKGKQLCGTCIVNVTDGAINTNRKSMDEASTLRENPDSYRLSCVAFAYGDVTVETFPPITASQWTR